jgi:hypothetical protein
MIHHDSDNHKANQFRRRQLFHKDLLLFSFVLVVVFVYVEGSRLTENIDVIELFETNH